MGDKSRYPRVISHVVNSIASQYPPQYADMFQQKASANSGAALFGVWRSFIFVALGAGALWAFLTNRLKPKVAIIALGVVIAVDLWSVERMYWIFSAPASKTYATDPAIEAICLKTIAKKVERFILLLGEDLRPIVPYLRYLLSVDPGEAAVLEGDGSEQQRVDDGVNRGSRTDPESKGDDDQQGHRLVASPGLQGLQHRNAIIGDGEEGRGPVAAAQVQ